MNTLLATVRRALENARIILSRGVLLYYEALIRPRAEGEDARRREFIFNVIVSTILLLLVVFGLQVVHVEIAKPHYDGVRHGFILFFILFFAGILFLSRRGLTDLASYLLIGLYFFGNTYAIYRWGIELPAGILGYAVTIIVSSILVSTRFGFAMTAIAATTMISIGYGQTHAGIAAETGWRSTPMEWNDAFENAIFYLFAMVVSWLSNREIAASLKRARASEKALIEERNLLEVRIEERTKELKAAELEKASQLYRFIEFGKLSSGIFHDILNPIAAMSLSVEELSQKNGLQAPGALEQIERAMRASKRIESFIELAKKQLDAEGENGVFSLESEARDAIDLLLHKSRLAGAEVRLETSGDTLVHGNPVKFFQIAVNLISNAIDSYKETPVGRERPVVVRIESQNGTIDLSVSDNGCGIDPAFHALAFQPFFTTKGKRDGMGLGLSTAKAIIERDFDGEVLVKSQTGVGSTFVVRIPKSREAKDRRRNRIRPPYEKDLEGSPRP
jgi:signal transduction histidine kinase